MCAQPARWSARMVAGLLFLVTLSTSWQVALITPVSPSHWSVAHPLLELGPMLPIALEGLTSLL